MKNEMIEKAREIVEEMELDSKYGYIGIRVQEEPFELGEDVGEIIIRDAVVEYIVA